MMRETRKDYYEPKTDVRPLTFNREQEDTVLLVHHSHDVFVAPHAHIVVMTGPHMSELRSGVVIDKVFNHRKRVPGK